MLYNVICIICLSGEPQRGRHS